MAEFTITTLVPGQVKSLLSLQKENLISQLTIDTAQKQGFLTFQYSEDFMDTIMKSMSQPIAVSGDTVVAYALASSRKDSYENDLLKPLVTLSDKLKHSNRYLSEYQYYLMAQVCVKEGWRSKGIFDLLYEKHRELFSSTHDFMITEISLSNHRSLAAHARIGFKPLHQYVQDNVHWQVVIWDWN